MNLLIEYIVFVGFVMACLFAGSPTLRSPPSTKATTDGVVLFPSEFAITTGSLPSITETHEFVVPKSIPIIFPMILFFSFDRSINMPSPESMSNYDKKAKKKYKLCLNVRFYDMI